MKKLYFQDKVIIFDSSYNTKNQKDMILYHNQTPESVIELLRGRDILIFGCEDEDIDFENFRAQYKNIYAAGGVVKSHANGSTLMIYRNNHWDLPKGKIEQGESTEQCAIREVMEETGVENISHTHKTPYVTHHIYDTYGTWEFKTTYWYEMSHLGEPQRLKPQTEEGITEVEWVDNTTTFEHVKDSYASIKSVIEHFNR